jgi:ribosome maturation factor RimP
MFEKQRIKELTEEFLSGTDIFLVSVKVSGSNKITIMADKNDGITIDECARIHQHIVNSLGTASEDYELQVSSPGLDLPFCVIEQYYKNEGKKVEVLDIEGNKYSGKLKNVTTGGFELETEIKVKGKQKELKDLSFNIDQIKSTRVILTIK